LLSANETYNEKEVLLRIAEGDEKAFAQLINKYNGSLYTFVSTYIALKHQHLVDEVVCDVFMQIWLTRETLPSLTHLGNYLFILARNKGLNALKKELREHKRRYCLVAGIADPEEMQRQVEENKALDLIDEAVAALPGQQQKVWILSRKKSLSYAQVASELNISRETVKSYLQAANQSIKKYVLTHLDDFTSSIIFLLIFLESIHPLS
jgi:RNA polymerase sigma-19 factor, ECF subfamily